MPLYSQSFLEEIRQRVPVSEVAGSRVQLKRAGRELRGLSPFSKENTPSFFVNDEKARWFDFSAGKDGDIFDFVMEVDGLEFPEAVEKLAQRAGLSLPQMDPQALAEGLRRDKIRECLLAACDYYREAFGKSQEATAYAKMRGLDDEACARWRIGYAPGKGDANRFGFDEETLAAAGLINTDPDAKIKERFRDRLMFPISDSRGRIVGFSGRAMGDAQPKYLNGPETEVFKKGELLFGYDHARVKVLSGAKLVIVEGHVDAISLSRSSDHIAAVASMGTAVTAAQIALAWKLHDEPIALFDADGAGLRAREKMAALALPMVKPGKSLAFASCPDGYDPDKLVQEEGPEAVQALIDKAEPLARQVWRSLTDDARLDTPEGRAAVETAIGEAIGSIRDDATRDQYRAEYRRAWQTMMKGAQIVIERPRYQSKFGAVKVNENPSLGRQTMEYLIKGVAPARQLMMIMGRSQSGKSFQTIDMAMAVARGADYVGRKVQQAGVIYCFYEAQEGAEKRVRAYFQGHGIDPESTAFAYLTSPPNLFESDENVNALIHECRAIGADMPVPVGLIVIDTHNAATRGASEIDSKEIGRIIDRYERIRLRTGCAVWVVGHTNKDGAHRGNEQITNNFPTVMKVEVVSDRKGRVDVPRKDDDGRLLRRVIMDKQREGDTFHWDFVLKQVRLGEDMDGDPITSCIIDEPARSTQDEDRDETPTGNKNGAMLLRAAETDFFRAVLSALDEYGEDPPPELRARLPESIAKVVQWGNVSLRFRAGLPQNEGEVDDAYLKRITGLMNRSRDPLVRYRVIGCEQAKLPDGTKRHFVWPTGRVVKGPGLKYPASAFVEEPKPKLPEPSPLMKPEDYDSMTQVPF